MYDIGQSIYRTPTNTTTDDGIEISQCAKPQAKNFIAADGFWRLELGREALLKQGWPVARFEELIDTSSDALLHNLAGNAFAGTAVLAMATAVLFTSPWAQQQDKNMQSTECEVEHAMQAAMASLGSLS